MFWMMIQNLYEAQNSMASGLSPSYDSALGCGLDKRLGSVPIQGKRFRRSSLNVALPLILFLSYSP